MIRCFRSAAHRLCLGSRKRVALIHPIHELLSGGKANLSAGDSVRMAERMRAAGCQVELEIWPRMPHTWQVWARVLPEARAAIERIGAFVQSKVEPQAVR